MERSKLTTLCYMEREGEWLMLHRVSKKNDVNKDKWIGIGGHFEVLPQLSVSFILRIH